MELTAPDSLNFSVDRAGFISVVDNLIDNAVRYAPEGGSVVISLTWSLINFS